MSVLIITNNFDHVTDYVIDWLQHYNCKVFRLTFEDFLRKASLYIDPSFRSKLIIEIEGVQVKSGWLRKVTFDDERLMDLEKKFGFRDGYEIFKYFNKESSVLKQYILNGKNFKWLCDYNTVNINKIEVLECAKDSKLLIPTTAIVNDKHTLSKFLLQNNISKFIVKSVGENLSLFHSDGVSIFQPVKSFSTKSLDTFPEKFAPSLIQEEIAKKIDIRIFYLDGQFYSMAIEADNIDCRLSDEKTKYYPIALPKMVESKLKGLMIKLKLNLGCIDMVMDYKDDFFFLEITPTGEFSQLSNYCNYDIEEKIAKYLLYEC